MNTIIIDGLAFSLPLFIMAVGGIYSEKEWCDQPGARRTSGLRCVCRRTGCGSRGGKMSGSSALPFYLAMIFAMVGGLLFS